MKKPVYCFIDDSEFEINLMRTVIAPHEPGVDFVCCQTFKECNELLSECGIYPALFILDLYGSPELPDEKDIPGFEALKERTVGFRSIDDVYKGLDEHSGPAKVQEFLKRLFSIVHDWRTFHSDVFGEMGHTTEYGKNNFRQVRRFYPLAPAVFYTRKSTIEDAIDLFRLDIDGLALKPTGQGGEDIRTVTETMAENLLTQWRTILKKRLGNTLVDGVFRCQEAKPDFPAGIEDMRKLAELLPKDDELFTGQFRETAEACINFWEKRNMNGKRI